MTTTIKVTSHNYPAQVEVIDNGKVIVEKRILRPEDGEQTFYCTTTRSLHITDLEYDHPDVLALPPVKAPA